MQTISLLERHRETPTRLPMKAVPDEGLPNVMHCYVGIEITELSLYPYLHTIKQPRRKLQAVGDTAHGSYCLLLSLLHEPNIHLLVSCRHQAMSTVTINVAGPLISLT